MDHLQKDAREPVFLPVSDACHRVSLSADLQSFRPAGSDRRRGGTAVICSDSRAIEAEEVRSKLVMEGKGKSTLEALSQGGRVCLAWVSAWELRNRP